MKSHQTFHPLKLDQYFLKKFALVVRMLTLSPVFKTSGKVFEQFSCAGFPSLLQFPNPLVRPLTRIAASNIVLATTKLDQEKTYSPSEGAVKNPL